mgnify:CR=1 FL=1
MKEFKYTIDGKEYHVAIGGVSDDYVADVTVNGETFQVQMEKPEKPEEPEKPEKKKLLVSLLREEDKSVLVFSRTKHGADNISRLLSKSGIRSEAIHGNKSQNHRQRVLTDFKSGKIRVMVATDIAARGIDIRELEIVINYDLPDVPETYVHRIGRTGRAGHSGTALTFCTPDERPLMKDIQRLTGKKLNAETYRA